MTPPPHEPTARALLPLRAARVVRPTLDLDRADHFYGHVVGLPVMAALHENDGVDGVIFGLPDAPAQLEIVHSPHGERATPSTEDALVLQVDDQSAADDLAARLREAGATEITHDPAVHPCWAGQGATVFADPDGYRLVVTPTATDVPFDLPWRAVPAGPVRDAYLPLFHLADDSADAVRGYYQTGTLYAFDTDAGDPLGIVLAIDEPDEPDGAVELKAVAVDERHHGRGVGRRMLRAVLDELRARGVRRVVVGTSSAGTGQLAFYQKAGFRLHRIERDYFSAERGYPPDLCDDGIPVRDMVWMDQPLDALESASPPSPP